MPSMPKFCAILCFCLLWQRAGAQATLPESFRNEVQRAQSIPYITSTSSQFIIHAAPSDGWRPMAISAALEQVYVRLDTPLTAVTCERIKSALLAKLGASDQWHGRVSIFLHQARRLDEPVVIYSHANGGDWSYYLKLPDTIERRRLVSAIVDVVLLEMANRSAERSAEIPFWLAEGLTQQLIAESLGDLVVDAPKDGGHDIHTSLLYFDGTNAPPLQHTHEFLANHPPLTLEELSWPAEGREETEIFRASAQLFVSELLHLDDGPACLRNMIAALPRHLNWQVSFLDGFHARFASELELEKWWDLTVVNFTGRDLAQTWPHAESWHQLDELLHTGAEVRTSADELPIHTEVTLQTLIGNWGYDLQQGVLKDKLAQFGRLRASVSQDLCGLVDGYHQVLQNYVNAREKSLVQRSTTVQRALGPDRLALETIQELNVLDAEREAMRNGPSPAAGATSASISH